MLEILFQNRRRVNLVKDPLCSHHCGEGDGFLCHTTCDIGWHTPALGESGMGQEKVTGTSNGRGWLFWKYSTNGNMIKRVVSNCVKGTSENITSIYASKKTESKISASKRKFICLKYQVHISSWRTNACYPFNTFFFSVGYKYIIPNISMTN